ncbi:MAG: hypothetical protein KA715_13360 [Xanthomonadaceae bacterium]|nr:hypothetical protein [Xanthomonadaceae bacterium]
MNIIKNKRGQGLTEYMILVFLVAAVSVGTVHTMGRTLKTKLETAQRQIVREVVLED